MLACNRGATSGGSAITTAAQEPWPLVGRDGALATADRIMHAGDSSLIVVADPGVGRTRLLSEIGRRLRPETRVVHLRGAGPEPQPAFTSLLPLVADGRSAPPADLRFALVCALSRRGRDGALPVVLVDDAHHVDPSSLALLTLLAGHHKIRLVCTTWALAEPAALTALWKDSHAQRLCLDPLGIDVLEELLQTALGGPVDPLMVLTLHQEAGGNLVLLREVIHSGLRSGRLTRRYGYWLLSGPLVVNDRMRQLLQPSSRDVPPEVLTIATAVGLVHPIPVDVLLEAGFGEPELDNAERAGLVVTVEGEDGLHVRPVSGLQGAVLVQDQSALACRRLARRLAEALAARPYRATADEVNPSELSLALSVRASSSATRTALRAGTAGKDAAVLTLTQSGPGAGHTEGSVQQPRVPGPVESAAAGAAALVATRATALCPDDSAGPPRDEQRDGDGLARAVRAAGMVRAGKVRSALTLLESSPARADDEGRGGPGEELRDALLLVRCTALTLDGQPSETVGIAEGRHLAALRASSRPRQAAWAWLRGWVELMLGRPETSTPWLREAAALADDGPVEPPFPSRERCLADLALALGQAGTDAEARTVTAELTAFPHDLLPDRDIPAAWLAARAGDPQAADLATTAIRRCVEADAISSALLHAIGVARFTPGPQLAGALACVQAPDGVLLQTAHEFVSALDASAPERLERCGEALQRYGASAIAVEALGLAERSYRTAGARGAAATVRRRSQLLAGSTGVRHLPVPSQGESHVLLTPREYEVASRAANGRQNREISELLGISVRTVENHLQSVYGKLEVRNRRALAEALSSLPPSSALLG